MFNCLEGCYRIAPFWKFGKQIKQYTGRTNNNWSLENAVSHSLAEGTATRNTLFLAINSYCQSTPNSNKHANQTHGSSRCELGLVLLLLLNPIFWESNTLSASVSPTVPRRVCHKFIKSMSKKFSWCRRWTTQSKTTKRLQFYHFAIAMANVSSIYLKTFFFANSKRRNGLSWCRIAFAKASYYGTCQIQHKERWETQNLSKQSCLNLAHDPKDGQLPSTNITCFQSRCQVFVRQIPSVHVRSMLGPAIRIPIGEICNGRFVWSWSHVHDIPHLEIVVWSTENGSTWSTVPHFAMVHSSKNEYACYEMLWKLLCAGEMWMEWGWWDQYPPKRMRSLHIVDSKYLWEINIMI